MKIFTPFLDLLNTYDPIQSPGITSNPVSAHKDTGDSFWGQHNSHSAPTTYGAKPPMHQLLAEADLGSESTWTQVLDTDSIPY